MKLIKKHSATDLPENWDRLTDSYFQHRSFLLHCEQFNPCQQRYYLAFDQDQLIGGAIVYTLRIDLFTFSKTKSPIKMQVIGIPASVSASGLIGDPNVQEALIEQLKLEERGLLLGVNLSPELQLPFVIQVPILPNLEMPLTLSSWSDYLSGLRAPYRRRALRIREKFKAVTFSVTDCSTFTKDHHNLYLQIMKRTPNKLETLSEAFFQQLPSRFRLTSYFDKNELLCWHITCQDKHRLYFFFGGNNYAQNEKFDSYFNLLFGILEIAFEKGCTYLDLGQTAEIPKMRLGGQLIPKQMFLFHRNKLIFWLINQFKYYIGYRAAFPEVHVFKQKKGDKE